MIKKFRIWDYDQNKMIYFDGIFNQKPWAETSIFPQYESYHQFHKVSEPMQYIGLTDKNNQEIYEEDFVKDDIGFEEDEDIYKVNFDEGCFKLGTIPSNELAHNDTLNLFIIVGNVFQNQNIKEN